MEVQFAPAHKGLFTWGKFQIFNLSWYKLGESKLTDFFLSLLILLPQSIRVLNSPSLRLA